MNDARQRPVAIITGAARGLGASTARKLANAGWQVVLFDICTDDPALPYKLATTGDMEESVANCRAAAGDGGRVIAVAGDVRQADHLKAAAGMAIERFGGLDAAVAAAGVIAGGSPAWETSEEVWNALIGVNLSGVWNLARAAIPAMLNRPEPRRGRFVAVSSAAGVRGFPQIAAYTAAKHGVIGLVRSIAAELGGSGITANAVCPGSTDTAILAATADILAVPTVEEFAIHHVTNRLLKPDEVANLIAWLCSPESSAITGAVLAADAGMTAK